MVLMRSIGMKSNRAAGLIADKRIGLEDIVQFLRDIAGAPVSDVEGAHSLAGEGIAVEQRNQFERPPHVPAVIENDQQIRGIVIIQLAAVSDERQQNL